MFVGLFRIYNQDLDKVINFVLQKYEHNEKLNLVFRLYANEINRLFYYMCLDQDTIRITINKFNVLNNKAEDMKVHRLKLHAFLDNASDPYNKIGLSEIIW